jgi:hypothetical protein
LESQLQGCKSITPADVQGAMEQRDDLVKWEWGIRSIVDGVHTERIMPVATEIEARDWQNRFPQSYVTVKRRAPGDWESIPLETQVLTHDEVERLKADLCTRAQPHGGPCNGFPRMACKIRPGSLIPDRDAESARIGQAILKASQATNLQQELRAEPQAELGADNAWYARRLHECNAKIQRLEAQLKQQANLAPSKEDTGRRG